MKQQSQHESKVSLLHIDEILLETEFVTSSHSKLYSLHGTDKQDAVLNAVVKSLGYAKQSEQYHQTESQKRAAEHCCVHCRLH